jgi:nucleotide-binding universal stress UspA family protein
MNGLIEKVDVVVVLGHSGLTGALLGSVSRAVLQHAYCPVFLVG